ncbi:MAG: dCTP deaminase [Candidatus Peregrinibacteria bacterium]
MILSDKTIKSMLETGILTIDPIDEHSIQPASVDCRLGSHFLIMEENQMSLLTLDSEIHYREMESDSITIPPHSFILATTREYVKLPHDLTAFVEGRSSIGRMGLFIQNAGWVDPGFEGKITLELYNASSLPIKLQSGKRVCQLVFCKMDQKAQSPYKGKYQGQTQSVGSRIFMDKDKI